MQEDEGTKSKNEKKEDFNVVVTYAENGKGRSFQSIVENIVIRKMEDMN